MYALFERFELRITMDDAESCSQQGENIENVQALVRVPYIARQLAKLDPEKVRAEMAEVGAWDDEELADHDDNCEHLVWIACNNIVEEKREKTR